MFVGLSLPSKDPQVDQLLFMNYTLQTHVRWADLLSGFTIVLPTITVTSYNNVHSQLYGHVLQFHGNQHTINNNNTLHSLMMVRYQWIIHYTQY